MSCSLVCFHCLQLFPRNIVEIERYPRWWPVRISAEVRRLERKIEDISPYGYGLTEMFASYSYTTGDHDFPEVKAASTFYRIAKPFPRGVRRNLPVFTSTRTGYLQPYTETPYLLVSIKQSSWSHNYMLPCGHFTEQFVLF